MALPASSGLPAAYQYIKHYPTKNPKNIHIGPLCAFNHRYVSYGQIEAYLLAMGAVITAKQNGTAVPIPTSPKSASVPAVTEHMSFNKWLLLTHPDEYKATELFAIFREGTISEGILNRRGTSFSYGDFSHCDFSFCTFINCKISNFQSSLLIGSEFQQCVASGTAVSNADLSCARLLNCDFSGCIGFLRIDYAVLVTCNFSNCRFTQISLDDAQWDDATFQSFHNSEMSSGGVDGAEVMVKMEGLLKVAQLDHQKKIDDFKKVNEYLCFVREVALCTTVSQHDARMWALL